MNPQTGTKVGANLTASPVFWICDPLTSPKCPRGIDGRILFSLCPFPDESADVYQMWCQWVHPFDSFPRLLNLWTLLPKCPWVIEGGLVFCPFPDESADVNQSWCQLDIFPRVLNLWPPKTSQLPTYVSRGKCLAYIHSHMNLHMCAKFGANRSSRLVAFSEFVLTLVRVLAAVRADSRSVGARGGVNDILPACKNWIIYRDLSGADVRMAKHSYSSLNSSMVTTVQFVSITTYNASDCSATCGDATTVTLGSAKYAIRNCLTEQFQQFELITR